MVKRSGTTIVTDGHSTSAWFDLWDDFCPLINGVTPRMVTNAGFSLTSKVADISENGNWKWPATWNSFFPNSLAPILVESQHDVLQWKDQLGKLTNFYVGTAWEDIRPRDGIVDWYHLVWFNHCIPKHSFLLWLAIMKKLKTQDKIRRWDLQQTLLLCPLCELQSYSHSHLFFECPYAKEVWFEVNMKADLHQQSTVWEDIIQDMILFSKKTSIFSVISKLTLVASVYFIWQERITRLFKKRKRTKEELVQVVIETIRFKLMTFRFKNNSRVERAMVVWRLPKTLLSTNSSS
uniref:uncharacterized protein LOC122601889 n=1 Tax=Erigeron canadensis TaxID=72917 RepID=UPI001CB89ED1|nr:uncharacterized protein LOC122601889 [Erigeron canadensis]